MTRHIRLSSAIAAALIVGWAGAASAQTRTLTIRATDAGGSFSGAARVVAGALGSCADTTCTYVVNDGAAVRLAADYPGRFSAGTGPASACALSTCSFTMTADASVTATFTAGGGPTATLTATVNGDGAGTIRADGVPCSSGVCVFTYL